ncbi:MULTISPECIES: hypothetical protein [Paenibacillus]|uniref:DUF4179 domain-containing protein n=1 Tax=Paenibacillus lactis TaxID=228574 RepID=A0ABS4F604_9BACL|nr:hypothetical protein [Paenibacillus lactis]MBP1891672.1 hypothetical protein [Paenibacillus lactis]MCM3494134.1 hypothetical protein [Paenibacillus lactis]GIO88915.1 hypothetical protein J31TS3_01420 [Paenibacillus lactis]HAF97891.1 hypothetical protein [Paenibacillus lactis]
MTGKDRYEQIEIPAQLANVMESARHKAAARKRSLRLMRYSSVVAASLALLFVVNIPGVANALSKVPVVGSIVQVLQFGGGGERTDGVSVNTETVADVLRINFDQAGETVSSVPSYTVEHREAPNRLIFTLNGVRNFDYDAVKSDLLALSLVEDVYENIILDDSAMRFVVELKDGVTHSVSEYRDPGYIELKLAFTGKQATPREVFYIRSEAMPQGESLAILEEIYYEDDVTFIKTAGGGFIAAIGGFDTREEAEQRLSEISSREGYAGDLRIDSWMSNAHPE